MYSIYITNKSGAAPIYIRLQHQKLSAMNPHFCQELDDIKNRKVRGSVNSHLLQWGFCAIAADQTMSFAVDVINEGPRKYASMYAGSKLWTMDMEIFCIRYGCLFVNRSEGSAVEYCLYPTNPQPVWIPFKNGSQLPENIIKAGSQGRYFGRSAGYGGFPCQVTYTGHSGFQFAAIYYESTRTANWCYGGKVTHGELLKDTGHEFVPANAGDPVPPHAVIGGVAVPEGSLYLGRVGGNTPCAITAVGGKIKHFCYNYNEVQSGEILILTNDPYIFNPTT